MTRFASQSLAAFAAVLMMAVSMNAIVTVPPVQAHSVTAPVLA